MEIKKTNRKQGIHSFFMNFSNYWPITGGHDLWGRRLGRWRSCYRGVAPRTAASMVEMRKRGLDRTGEKQGIPFLLDFWQSRWPTVRFGARGERKEGEEERSEPYPSFDGISDLYFLLNTIMGGHSFNGEKRKENRLCSP